MDNFRCQTCRQTFFLPRFTISFKAGQLIYTTRVGEVTCPTCGATGVLSITTGELCINIGEYGSATYVDKQAMLRRRAKRAMRRDEEQRRVLDTEFRGQCNEKHY